MIKIRKVRYGNGPISDKLIRLEPLRPNHARILYKYLKDASLYEFIPENPPTSIRKLSDRYKRLAVGHSTDGRETWLNWAIFNKRGKRYVGTVQATITGTKAEVAYVIFRKYWGKGFGSRANC